MRKLSLILLALPIIATAVFAQFYINGTSETIIVPPEEITFTGDFSSIGGMVSIEVYIDENSDGIPEPLELSSILGIIDGVPSIGWPNDSIIPGDDDTLIDGDFTYSTLFEMESNPIFANDTIDIFYVARDLDGSADTALLHVVLPDYIEEAEVPYVFGYVRALDDSLPISGALCIAVPDDGDQKFSASDSTGRFAVSLDDTGSITVITVPLDGVHLGTYAMVALHSAADSAQVDEYCGVAPSNVTGTVSMVPSGPLLPSLFVTGFNGASYTLSATTVDPVTGEYSLPAVVGPTEVQLSQMSLGAGDFPTGFLVDPPAADVDVPDSGVITDVDFAIRRVDAAISGTMVDSTSGNVPLAFIPVDAENEDGNTFSTVTDSMGNFLIPVKGGCWYHIYVDPYNAVPSPVLDDSVYVPEGDTVSHMSFMLFDLSTMPIVRGRITDVAGDPVEGAYVIAYNEDLAYPLSWQYVMSDSVGDYEFLNLPPWEGEWKLGAYGVGYGLQSPRLYSFAELPEDTILENMDIQFGGTSIGESRFLRVAAFELGDVFPNPFNSEARLNILANEDIANIDISLYNILGKKVRRVYSGSIAEGRHSFTIDMKSMASGVYFVKVKTDGLSRCRTLNLKK